MLQFITHHNERFSYLDAARMALEGGCRWIQLRMKEADEQTFVDTARQVRKMCDTCNATFIIDDHVELVREVHADGVHLGLKDMPADEARHLLGPDFIIGGTANSLEDVILQASRGVNYIGCGPFRFTTTKEKLAPVLGIEGYRAIVQGMKEHHINLPVVAIGGITRADIPAIMQTGVSGIALSGCILNADSPVEETRLVLNT